MYAILMDINSLTDRYAALKDLDEQIREIKEKEITVQIPPQTAATAVHNPNPFKTSFSPSAGAPVSTNTTYSTPPTNPFKTETNGFSFAQSQFQPVHFNGFAPTPAINGFQSGGNMFGVSWRYRRLSDESRTMKGKYL